MSYYPSDEFWLLGTSQLSQELKPNLFAVFFDTAEVVPFHRATKG
jgi:hypothetical protein